MRDGTFEYDSKEPVKTDWAQYDQAQIYEMVNYLNNIRDLVNIAYKRIKERTPPRKRGMVDRQLLLPTLRKLYCCKHIWNRQTGWLKGFYFYFMRNHA